MEKKKGELSTGVHKANARTKQPRIKSFGRFLESGRFPKGGALWSPSAEGEIPQPPDLMHKDWTKTTNHRWPSGILNQKALAHCFMGFAALWDRCLIGMNPIKGFSSASSGPQAGLPHNQSRQIGHPPNLIPTACYTHKGTFPTDRKRYANQVYHMERVQINGNQKEGFLV